MDHTRAGVGVDGAGHSCSHATADEEMYDVHCIRGQQSRDYQHTDGGMDVSHMLAVEDA